MKTRPQRLCIHPKDIAKITGKIERFSGEFIQRIRLRLGKEEHQFITIEEFCNDAGLQEEKVKELIGD